VYSGQALVSTQQEHSGQLLRYSLSQAITGFIVSPKHVQDRMYAVANLKLGIAPILGAVVAAGLYLLLKKLHYEDVNGDADKSADEQSLLESHSELERTIKKWNGQNSRSNTMSWATQARLQDLPHPLRLYRLSGLDDYKQQREIQYAEMEEGRVENMKKQRAERWSSRNVI
jgi:hypothetical protein